MERKCTYNDICDISAKLDRERRQFIEDEEIKSQLWESKEKNDLSLIITIPRDFLHF